MNNIFINCNHQLRSGWKIAIAILFIAISTIILSILMTTIAPLLRLTLSAQVLNTIVSCTQQLIIILIVLTLWKLIDKKSLTELGLPNIKNHKKAFIYGLLGGAISLTSVSIILLCIDSVALTNSIVSPSFSLPIITSLIMYIFVGFNEEIVFRGYFLSVLKQCSNKYVPYVASAVLFSLAHSMNPGISILAYINLFLFGIFLSYVIYKTKNLWFGIGFHITWNFFEGNVWGFLVSGGNDSNSIYTLKVLNDNIINGGTFGPEGGLTVTVVLIVSMLIIYKFVPSKAE